MYMMQIQRHAGDLSVPPFFGKREKKGKVFEGKGLQTKLDRYSPPDECR